MSNDKYDYERHRNVSLPYCVGGISLVFDGKKLSMLAVIDNKAFWKSYNAVSGKPDGNKKFDYSLESQKKKNHGPIPEGTYHIYPSEFWSLTWKHTIKDKMSWGSYRITLHPDMGTETYGRGGFFIHGGFFPGSIGCIDLTAEIDKFYDDLMKVIGKNTECRIQLLVKYS